MKEIRRRVQGPSTRSEYSTGNVDRAAPVKESPAAAAPLAEKSQGQTTMPGRNLSPAEFNTAIAHFYRGEVQRANTWRNRLDTTTNWAVITAAGTLSFAFSSPANPHFVIPINSVLIAYFLFIEARRYRYYEIWSSRIRVIETGYFARMLAPNSAPPDSEWAAHLADDLLTPHFTISEWEAAGRRLRRNYLWIFILLAVCWNLKVYLHPQPAADFDEFIARAAVGIIPGWFVFLIGVIFNSAVLVFALATVRLREATGEVLPHHQFTFNTFRRMTDWTRDAATRRRTTMRRTKRARARARGGRSTGSLSGEWKRPETGELQKPVETEPVTKQSEADAPLPVIRS